MTENPASASMAASQAAIASAKAGSCSSSSRPMPTHCEPCPGNTKTTVGAASLAARARAPPGGTAPDAATSSAVRRASIDPTASASRWFIGVRVVASE